MNRRLADLTAVAGVGVRQYKRGAAPWPERGVLVRAIVDACEDAGFDPADIDGFASYGDDNNEPVRLMPDLGIRDLAWSSSVWGGGGPDRSRPESRPIPPRPRWRRAWIP